MAGQVFTRFDDQLLEHIRCDRNAKAISMLNQELAQAYDEFGTLLYYSATWENDVVARKLIELGTHVDHRGRGGRTALMIAVLKKHVVFVKILLEANANVDIVDVAGKSTLKMALDLKNFVPNIVDAFAGKLKTESRTIEELADRLISGGCNMHHAAILGDVNLMKCMLGRGIDMNSKGRKKRTALHVVAQLNRLNLSNWLINNGADLNEIDKRGDDALTMSVVNGNKNIAKILLERGVDPNKRNHRNNYTPLFAIFENSEEQCTECVELLLQHGASLRYYHAYTDWTIFDQALHTFNHEAVELLIAHLAVLEMIGTSITESVMYCKDVDYQLELTGYKNFYEQCMQVLTIIVFEKLSLLNLLRASERKMRHYVRNKTFISKVKQVCSEHNIKKSYSYYYNTLMNRIAKASRVMELEDKAISWISRMCKRNRNLGYYSAKEIVEYLDERDLEQLVHVS